MLASPGFSALLLDMVGYNSYKHLVNPPSLVSLQLLFSSLIAAETGLAGVYTVFKKGAAQDKQCQGVEYSGRGGQNARAREYRSSKTRQYRQVERTFLQLSTRQAVHFRRPCATETQRQLRQDRRRQYSIPIRLSVANSDLSIEPREQE